MAIFGGTFSNTSRRRSNTSGTGNSPPPVFGIPGATLIEPDPADNPNLRGDTGITQPAFDLQEQTRLEDSLSRARQEKEAARQRAIDVHNEQLTRGASRRAERLSTEQQRSDEAARAELLKREDAARRRARAEQRNAMAAQRAAEEALLQRRFDLNQQEFTNRLGAVQQLVGGTPASGTSASGGTVGPSTVQHSGNAIQGNEEAARAAAFAAAKELGGLNANAALASLQGLSEDQGLMGSSIQGSGQQSIINSALGSINNFTRDQLLSDLDRSADISDLTYQGGITQRGQDLQLRQALLSLLNSGVVY